MRVWPIGTTVGKVKNGGAKLLEPATPAEPMLRLLVRSRRSATTSAHGRCTSLLGPKPRGDHAMTAARALQPIGIGQAEPFCLEKQS